MTLLTTLLAFAVAIGVLVTIHEAGHYLAARSVGVYSDRFSIGFGPVLYSFKSKDGTQWAISAIPLGGYVKFLDESVEEVPPHLLAKAYNRASVWARIWIVSAGPLANFVLAAVIYTGLNIYGVQELGPQIAKPAAQSLLGQSGLAQGGKVLNIDGKPVTTFGDVRLALVNAIGRDALVPVEVEHPDRTISTVKVNMSGVGKGDLNETMTRDLGLSPAPAQAVLGKLAPDGAAAGAGLQTGDILKAANGQPIESIKAFVESIQAQPGKPIALTVDRAGVPLQINVTPASVADQKTGKMVGRVGAEIGAKRDMVTLSLNPFSASLRAVEQVWDTSWLSLKVMGKMIIGEVSLKNLSGPVTIADYAGQSARAGFATYFLFLALISVSIGVLNLLPIPVLDGGLLLYYLGEIIRGKPLPDRFVQIGRNVGVVMVLSMMSLALFNDVMRFFQ